jgi:hypothetical protein
VVTAWPVPERLITSEEGVPFVTRVIEPFEALAADGVNVALKFAVAPAAIVVDVLRPTCAKPEPVTVICENVSVALPLFLSVTCCESVLPTATVPNATLEGFDEICACSPVPLNEITSDEFGAVDVTVMLPDAAPLVVGANLAVSVAVAPAPIDCPAVTPVALKPAPLAVTPFTVMAELPWFVSVIACEPFEPTTTLPKLKVFGFAVSDVFDATALPVRAIDCEVDAPLSVKLMLPVTPVVEVGANVTLNVVEAPGATAAGIERPLMLKPVPETVAAETVRPEFPVLLSVTVWVLVCPTTMLLKFKEDGEKEAFACMPVPLNAIPRLELEASLVTVSMPLLADVEVGANFTCTVALWPTVSVAVGLPLTTV